MACAVAQILKMCLFSCAQNLICANCVYVSGTESFDANFDMFEHVLSVLGRILVQTYVA